MCLFADKVLAIIGAVPLNERRSVFTVKKRVFSDKKHIELGYYLGMIVFNFMIFYYNCELLLILL